MWTHSIYTWNLKHAWGEGVTGSRAFREGDEGIRVREWWEGGRIGSGEGKLREGWRQGAVREEWHWRGMRGREEEDRGTSHHWYKQHKCREVIYLIITGKNAQSLLLQLLCHAWAHALSSSPHPLLRWPHLFLAQSCWFSTDPAHFVRSSEVRFEFGAAKS